MITVGGQIETLVVVRGYHGYAAFGLAVR